MSHQGVDVSDGMADSSASTHFLPEVRADTRVHTFRGTPLEVLHLSPQQVRQVTDRLSHQAVLRLRTMAEEHIVGSLEKTARLWLEVDSPFTTIALELLPAITGYSRPVIEYSLRHLLGQIAVPHLQRLVGGIEEPPPANRSKAEIPTLRDHEPRLVTHFCAGNIPGLAIEAMVFSLLARVPAFVKVGSGEPLLGALFARSLAQVDAELARCVAVAWWPGGSAELERAACENATVVVGTGDDATLATLRALVPPSARFIAHPHKLSVGVVGKDFGSDATAAAIAKDVALFDQQGCLSPQVVFIETPQPRGGLEEFAEQVQQVLTRVGTTLPAGALSLEEIAHVQQVCATLEMTGATIWRTAGLPFRTVVLLPSVSDLPVQLIPFRGGVSLQPVDSLSRLPGLLVPFNGKLQAVGVALSDSDLAWLFPRLESLGVSRICPFGEMQTPPLGWKADGTNPVKCLLVP